MSADMLVKLYDPKIRIDTALEDKLAAEGVCIKRALRANKTIIREFVTKTFDPQWADEVEASLFTGGTYLAVHEGKIIGFASYDGLFPDFFGPTGLAEEWRGHGIGKALLLRALVAMRDEKHYRYAIIGWTGPQPFYAKCANAVVIPDSIPFSYGQLVQIDPEKGGVL